MAEKSIYLIEFDASLAVDTKRSSERGRRWLCMVEIMIQKSNTLDAVFFLKFAPVSLETKFLIMVWNSKKEFTKYIVIKTATGDELNSAIQITVFKRLGIISITVHNNMKQRALVQSEKTSGFAELQKLDKIMDITLYFTILSNTVSQIVTHVLTGCLPIHHILSFLSARDLSSLAQCSKHLYNSVNCNILWKKICLQNNWTHYGDLTCNKKSFIEDILSNEMSRFSLCDLNHSSANVTYLDSICYWWQVFLRAIYIENNWKNGRYSLHYIRIDNFSNDKVILMEHNDSYLIFATSKKRILIYKIHSFQFVKSILLGESISCLSIHFNNLIFGLTNGGVFMLNCITFIYELKLNGEPFSVWKALELGNRICAIYTTGEIYIWSLSTNSLLFQLSGHMDEIFCYTSFTNQWLVTGGWDCKAIVWDIENGFLAVQLNGHEEAVSCMKMINEYLVTGSFDGNVRIFKWKENALLNTLIGSKEIYCLDVNKTRIIAAGSDSNIFVWNWDGNQLFRLPGHLGIIRYIKLINESRLISAGDMRRIMVWDVSKGFCENVLYRNPLQIGKFLVNDFCVIVASDSANPHISVLCFL